MTTLHLITNAKRSTAPATIGRRFHVTPIIYRFESGEILRYEYLLQAEDDEIATVWARGDVLEKKGSYELVSASADGDWTMQAVETTYLRDCIKCGCRWRSTQQEPDGGEMVRGWITSALESGNPDDIASMREYVSDYACAACDNETAEA